MGFKGLINLITSLNSEKHKKVTLEMQLFLKKNEKNTLYLKTYQRERLCMCLIGSVLCLSF